jgi:hypothetical protein
MSIGRPGLIQILYQLQFRIGTTNTLLTGQPRRTGMVLLTNDRQEISQS